MRVLWQYILTVCILVAGCALDADAQKSSRLKKQKQDAARRAKVAEQRLQANREAMRVNLNELNSLDAEIKMLDGQISALTVTSDSLRRIIVPLNDSIKSLSDRLETMKTSYARVLRNSYRNRSDMDELTFIFSASNFSQAWKRSQSLKQFARWRKKKSSEIQSSKIILEDQKLKLDSLTERNNRIMSTVKSKRKGLETKKTEVTRLVKQIEASSGELQREIDRRNKEMANLDNEIEKAIAAEEEEARRKEAEARKAKETAGTAVDKPSAGDAGSQPSASSGAKATPLSAADAKALSQQFESQKGKLPSPVSGKAVVVKKFGRQKHPRLPKVYTENAGIDIETDRGARVAAVFAGEVSQIFKLAGYNNVVVIRHGDYVTVYANIVDLAVSKGERVKSGQTIGRVYVDTADNNRSVLHFELRHEKEKQDPELWLKL